MRPSPQDDQHDRDGRTPGPVEPEIVDHFSSVFGRPATLEDLARYRRARARIELRVPPRLRRRLLDLVVRR